MAETTNISWCDSTFNPVVGCERISPACDHCYAAGWALRTGQSQLWNGARRRTTDANWRAPLQWEREHGQFEAEHGRRRRVFCASLADVFDNAWDPQWRSDLFKLIEATPNLDWLLLTKRIGNVRGMCGGVSAWPNVWLGATIANQAEADRDIPKLLATPAHVRFLSCEPLLGAIDLRQWIGEADRQAICASTHTAVGEDFDRCDITGLPCNAIDWVIAGGESGGKARPSHPDWFRSLRDQCAAAGVAFHHKQHGEWIEAHERTGEVYSDQAEYEQMAAECDGFISLDGHFVRSLDDAREDTKYRGMKRAGKKAAGRTLDGIIHDAFPEVV